MTTISDGISRQCARFIQNLSFGNLDQETLSIVKKCIIDWMGCAIGGSSTSAAQIVESLVMDMGGKPQATLLGNFNKTTILQAAMVNAYNSHILEMDDVHKSSISHPAAPVISTTFALAEHLGSSGKEMVEAIVAGYEVMIRIGEAISPSHYTLWHTTSTCGTFGAAAASAKLLHLDEQSVLHSLGNAGSQAAGLWEFASDNAMTKYLHCGKAAYNGLVSSLLAQKGFTGASQILEGPRGFFKAYSQETNFERSFKDWGIHYKIRETAFKPYASCRHTHGPINAVLNLCQREDITYENVESITVETYDVALPLVDNYDFSTPAAAKFCLPYCLASALILGQVGVDAFREEYLTDPRFKKLAFSVTLKSSEELNALYPLKWASRVVIQTNQGNSYDIFIDYPKGDPENTMSDTEIEEKYFSLTALRMERSKADSLLQQIKSIENRDSLINIFQKFFL
ncbi:MmgE/PrpD family protein [Fretibacterium sp. OH1220_COT-178]|nr:MmgE/PrpD family protein [Fretibacterium sp. OH1220_COT-178]